MNKLRRNRLYGFVIITYLLLTIPLAFKLNLGGDEAYSLESSSGNLITTYERAIKWEAQAPLYFLLLNIWRNANSSIFFARLFSVMAILAAILLFIDLLEKYLNSTNVVWYVLLFAFNPLTIWAALEIRLYALSILLSILVISLFIRRSDSDSRPYIRICFITVSIMGIYTYYYFVVLPITLIIASVFNNGIKKSKSSIIDFIIISLACLPIPFLSLNLLNEIPKKEFSMKGFAVGIKKLLQYQEQLVLPLGQLECSQLIRYLIRATVFFIVVSAIWSNRKKIINKTQYYFYPLYLTMSGLLFAIMASLFIRSELLTIRHFAFLLPPWILLLSLIIDTSKDKYRKYGTIAIILIVYMFALINEYRGMAKIGDYKRISNYIMKEEHKGQSILIFPNTEYLILKYYYKGLNPVFSIPREPSTNEFDLYRHRINSMTELDDLMARCVSGTDTIWMIILPVQEYMDVSYGLDLLEKYIAQKFVILNTRIFYRETRVYLLRNKGLLNEFSSECRIFH